MMSEKKRRTKARGNGTGTAFKRGSTWTAQVVVGWRVIAEDKPTVAITRSKGGFRTRDEALRYCPILLLGPQKPKEAPTLEEYWNTYQMGAYTALGPSKQGAYKTAWSKLSPISHTRIDQLTVATLQDLLIRKCPTYYTMKDCKTLLQTLFRIAAAEGYVNENIPTFIQLPKLEENERTPFSETEQAALWKLYESGDIRAALPLFMIYTGAMPGEARNLCIDMIDLEKRIVVGAGMKTKVRKKTPIVLAESIIPMVEDLIARAQQNKHLKNGHIWPSNANDFRALYYAALEAAGVRKLSPYCCRHTTATALAVNENIAPQTVKKVMRWSTAKMMDRYVHPDQNDALAAVDTIKKAR